MSELPEYEPPAVEDIDTSELPASVAPGTVFVGSRLPTSAPEEL